MLDDHEVKEVDRIKRMLTEVMLTGTSTTFAIRDGELHAMGFVIVDLPKLCWVVTERGRKWLNEHR